MSRASGTDRGQPVEPADHEGVSGAAGRQRLAATGSGAVGAGEAGVDVDPSGLDPEGGERVPLGGWVLRQRRLMLLPLFPVSRSGPGCTNARSWLHCRG